MDREDGRDSGGDCIVWVVDTAEDRVVGLAKNFDIRTDGHLHPDSVHRPGRHSPFVGQGQTRPVTKRKSATPLGQLGSSFRLSLSERHYFNTGKHGCEFRGVDDWTLAL